MGIFRMVRALAATVVLGCLSLVLGGCLVIGASTEKKGTPPTVGQELVDLKAARDRGAMNEGEYERAKAKLLQKVECHD